MNTDTELLRRYVDHGSQDAFAELVHRHIHLIYSAALRQVGGRSDLAKDVTQGVFLAAAESARSLVSHPILTGWLYTTTRFLAAKSVRAEKRWHARNQEFHAMDELCHQPSPEISWEKLQPVLDDAMHELSASDRQAILLRYFEGHPFAEVGSRCGVSENSARMRVDRALERLRGRLAKRGVTSAAAALGLALTGHAVCAAPPELAVAVSAVGLTGATAAGSATITTQVLKFMGMSKIKIGALCALAAVSAFVVLQSKSGARPSPSSVNRIDQSEEIARLTNENLRLKEENERIPALRLAASGVAAPNSGEVVSRSRMDQLRVLADLQREKLVNAQVTFVNANGKVSDAFARLFGLTPSDQATLQDAVDRARKKLGDLQVANAKVHPEGDSLLIDIKPFPEEGRVVYDELMNAFAQALGSERNAAFNTLGAEQVEKALGGMGAGERTLRLTPEARSGPNPGSTYRLEDKFSMPDGRRATTSSNWNRGRLASEIGPVTQLIPRSFLAE